VTALRQQIKAKAQCGLTAAALLIAATNALSTAFAQTAPSRIDTLEQRDRDLDAIRTEQRKATEAQTALAREIESIAADRRKLNQDLIATAERMRTLETKIAATEARLKPLDEDEARIRRSLVQRRAVLAEVLAALQRIGHRPPPALMTAPDDALQAVRTAIMLGAVLPEMRQEAEALAADLTRLAALRRDITRERETLARDAAALPPERDRLALLIDQRQRIQTEREKELDAEKTRASDLARQAGDLKDLIAKLEQSLSAPARAARESARNDQRPELSAFRDPGRLAPAIAFSTARGKLPVPVNGVKLRDFGASDPSGNTEKGLSIATRAGAQVTAPADGWVVYAGPFRTYGQLLILNAGGGYHVLLAGMDRISVELGQFVLTGEPVAVMGSGSQVAAIVAAGASQPVLYIEFRKDGVPIDPGPWWAASDSEKVRG